jgi:hypothetical protein
MLSPEEVQLGYWVAHGWPKTFLKPITEVAEYSGQEMLSIAYARPDDTPSIRSKRLKQWCQELPSLKIRMLKLHASHQYLLEAAAQIKGLEALSTGWGRLHTIEPVASCETLISLVIDSCPSLTGLSYLKSLHHLKMLSIDNVREAQDLRFISALQSLEDVSICGSIWTIQKVNDLWPLTELKNLQVLRLYSTKVLRDGLLPLHQLKKLVKFECSLYYSFEEFKALREALPSLKYGTPLEFNGPITKEDIIRRAMGVDPFTQDKRSI